MTVPSEINRSGPYLGNGVTTVFAYSFKIVNQAHLRVIRTDADGNETVLALGTNYTVAGAGNAGGGSITVSPAPVSGQKITILRKMPFTQNLDLENQGAYYADDVERAFDEAAMRDQQLAEEMKRAVKVPPGADDPDGQLSAELAKGILTLYPIIPDIKTVADNVDIVETVSDNIAEVKAVGTYIGAVLNVHNNMPKVQNVSDNMADVQNVSNNMGVVQSVNDNMPVVQNVNDNMADVQAVGTNIDAVQNIDANMAAVQNIDEHMDELLAADGSLLKLADQSYVATAGQTEFEMPAEANSASNVLVWIDGIRQVPNVDYTTLGPVLTLTDPLTVGQAVDVLVNTAVTIGEAQNVGELIGHEVALNAEIAQTFGARTKDSMADLIADIAMTPENTPVGVTVNVRGVGDYVRVASGGDVANGNELQFKSIGESSRPDMFTAATDVGKIRKALTAADRAAKSVTPNKADYFIDSRLDIGGESIVKFSNATIKQEDAANLPVLVRVGMGITDRSQRGVLELFTDGNRENNTTEVTGIEVNNLKRTMSKLVLGSINSDVGVRFSGDAELFQADTFTQHCGIGVHFTNDGVTTPDEALIHHTAHDCDTFFKADGPVKMSGELHISGEQSNSWGMDISCGWWNLYGEMRGVGNLGGGGYKQSGDSGVRVSVELIVSGGDSTNCEYLSDIQGGICQNLRIYGSGNFKNGMRIKNGADGSVMFVMVSNAGEGAGLLLQGASSSALCQNMHILPGSRVFGGASGQPALSLEFAFSNLIELSQVAGSIKIDAASGRNVITVHPRSVGNVSFENLRTQVDNVVVLRGAHSLTTLNAIVGLFRGVRVERVIDWQGAGGYYDGSRWVREDGLIASGTITIASGASSGFVPHGLGTGNPGAAALSIYPTSQVGSGISWYAQTQTNNLVVTLSGAAPSEITFSYVLRKTN